MPSKPNVTKTAPPRLLLTGFGPFADVRHNVSGQVVRELAAQSGWRGIFASVDALVLPVVYGEVRRMLDEACERLRPEVVLCTGVHRRETLRLERVARNRDDSALADEAGETRQGGQPIQAGAARCLWATLPLRLMHERLQGQGLAVEFSDSAGGYLCNHIFYHACQLTQQPHAWSPRWAGFVHIPPLTEPDAAFTYEELLRGLVACLHAVSEAWSG